MDEGLTANLALLATCLLVLPHFDRAKAWCRIVALGAVVALTLRYWVWRLSDTLPAFSLELGPLWIWLFFFLETLALVFTTWSAIVYMRRRDRHEQADAGEAILRASPAVPSVDLLIPTYNEDREILEPTIQAAVAIDYPNFQVYVLDDGERPWLEEMCQRYGANYLAREEHSHAKAGNLDHGIKHSSGEIIAVIDADFWCLPHMLHRMVGILLDPEIALVQTPQHYRNADPIQVNLRGQFAWTEEQRVFFDTALPARDAWNQSLCVGSGWAAKRVVLKDMGGYPIGSVAEDIYFGYCCKICGYKTAYLDEVLSIGLAPEDIATYVKQRVRWAMGSVQLLFLPRGPLRAPNLSLLDRWFYADLPLFWFSLIYLLALLLAPPMYAFFHAPVFHTTLDGVYEQIIPRMVVTTPVMLWISAGKALPVITPIKKYLYLFTLVPGLIRTVLNPKSPKFVVTLKGGDHTKTVVHWKLMAPYMVTLGINIVALLVSYSQSYGPAGWADYDAVNLALAGWNLLILFLCCLALVDLPRQPTDLVGPQMVTGSPMAALASIWRRLRW